MKNISRRTLIKTALKALPLTLINPSSLLAETLQCTPITSLPAIITQSGSYCLNQDFTVNAANNAAIVIAANNVSIDFNGHSITNTATTSNLSVGIHSCSRRNITIRNGTFYGFFTGIVMRNFRNLASGNLIEKMRLYLNGGCGILVSGNGYVIRSNHIQAASNGISPAPCQGTIGIAISDSNGCLVSDNNIVLSHATGNLSVGIYTTPYTPFQSNFNQDVLVERNRIAYSDIGIVSGGFTPHRYHANSVSNAYNPFVGGIDGGLNAAV